VIFTAQSVNYTPPVPSASSQTFLWSHDQATLACSTFPSYHAPMVEQPSNTLPGLPSSRLPNQSMPMCHATQVPSPMPMLWLKPNPSGISNLVGTQYLPPCQIIGPWVLPHGFPLFIFVNFFQILFHHILDVATRVRRFPSTEYGQTIATWLSCNANTT
jgi:hypothetical protein